MTGRAQAGRPPGGPLAAAFVAGLVHTAGFAPLSWWPLQVLALALPVRLADGRSARQAGWLGFAFGLGWFLSGISWVYVSMHRYGGMPAPMAGAATLAFAAYLALFPAAAVALWRSLDARLAARASPDARPRNPWTTTTVFRAAAFASAFTLAELGRGWLLTGFPWLAAGYAHTDSPLAGWAPVWGVFGTGWMAAFAAALGALARGAWRPASGRTGAGRGAAAAVVAGFAVFLAGALLARLEWTRPAGPPLSVRLVQGNVPQDLKFDPARTVAAIAAYTRRIVESPATLTVLPETAWTVPWASTPPDAAARILAHAHDGRAVAIGLPWVDGERVSNSVLLIDGGAPRARYDKRHLVPFGEFVPPGFRWFVDMMRIPLGDFGRGGPDQAPFAVGGQRVAFNICYEDLFGEEIIDALGGPAGATVLVNVSNIAWFGDSLALPQHLQIARMRVLETGRPMLRATNTGVTAAIDARGVVTARLPHFTEGALDVTVQGHAGLTPYARAGNLPVLLLSLGVLAALAAAGRRARRD